MPRPTFGWLDPPAYRGWVPGDPEQRFRTSFLDDGFEGERLRLSGSVVTQDGLALANARLEFWHADAGGNYHLTERKLTGIQRTRDDGTFTL